jgi:hypothetical protein
MKKGIQEYINLGGNPKDLFMGENTKELNALGFQVMLDANADAIRTNTKNIVKEKLEASEFVEAFFIMTPARPPHIYLSESGETAAKMCGEQELVKKIMEE